MPQYPIKNDIYLLNNKALGTLKEACNKYKLHNWGIKGTILRWITNDKYYNWYEDQIGSGIYDYENCGPAVATMAIKWTNPYFKTSTADARNNYFINGGWWNTNTIKNYLLDNNTSFFEYKFNNDIQLKNIIDKNNLIIICINTNYLTKNAVSEERTGRFYPGSIGHFIILKGYIQTTQELYFESYDPLSNNEHYLDYSLKGKDRFYTYKDIQNSITHRCINMIVIPNKNVKYKLY